MTATSAVWMYSKLHSEAHSLQSTAASPLMLLPLFQLLNVDTDGIKQNVTQTSLQPPGLLNLNVWLLLGPKISHVSDLNVQETASRTRCIQNLLLPPDKLSFVYNHSIYLPPYRYILPQWKYFPSITAAVATSSLLCSITQQCRQFPLEVI